MLILVKKETVFHETILIKSSIGIPSRSLLIYDLGKNILGWNLPQILSLQFFFMSPTNNNSLKKIMILS